MHQKEKLRVADAHAIAVIEETALDGHVVHERAIEAFEIREYEAPVVLFDFRMAARD